MAVLLEMVSMAEQNSNKPIHTVGKPGINAPSLACSTFLTVKCWARRMGSWRCRLCRFAEAMGVEGAPLALLPEWLSNAGVTGESAIQSLGSLACVLGT
jgi:hypothetical protein